MLGNTIIPVSFENSFLQIIVFTSLVGIILSKNPFLRDNFLQKELFKKNLLTENVPERSSLEKFSLENPSC